MKVLVTGFPSFAGVTTNTSQVLVDALRLGLVEMYNVEIVPTIVPVEYQAVEKVFDQLIADVHPDLVLSFGVGRHRHTFRFESVAYNLDDASLPDNAGEIRTESEIIQGAPQQIHSEIHIQALVDQLNGQGVAAEISQNAGRYVCNHLLYYGSYHQQRVPHPYLFLFTHLPTMENGFELEGSMYGVEIMIDSLRSIVQTQ